MWMELVRRLAFVIAAWAALAAAPACAQVTAYAAGMGALDRIDVGIDVRASVRARCGFADASVPGGAIDQPRFDEIGIDRQIPLRLNCTGASRIAVSSSNGGLETEARAAGYRSKALYDVELHLAADDGTKANASCSSDGLNGGGSCSFGGTASEANGLRLAAASTKNNGSYLRISAPPGSGEAPLLAGDYSDTLTITVSIAP